MDNLVLWVDPNFVTCLVKGGSQVPLDCGLWKSSTSRLGCFKGKDWSPKTNPQQQILLFGLKE